MSTRTVLPPEPPPDAQAVQEDMTPGIPFLPAGDRRIPPRIVARWALVALAIYFIGWLVWRSWPAMTPFVLGLILAYLALPAVNALARRMPRTLAILIVYIGFTGLLVGAVAYILPIFIDQLQQLYNSIPTIESAQKLAADLLRRYHEDVPPALQYPIDQAVNNALNTVQSNITLYLQRVGEFAFSQAIQVINLAAFIIGLLIVPIWVFYVLNDQEQAVTYTDRLLHPRIRPDFWSVCHIADRVLGDYVRGQLLVALSLAALVALGLVILQLMGFHIKYVLLLSVFAGITELIPFIGPYLGGIPGVLLGLSVSPLTGLAVAIVYIIVQQIEGSVLIPRIVGESIGIHPAVLMVILIAVGYTYGFAGVFLAAPLAAVARDLFIYVYRRLGGAPPAEAQAGLIRQRAAPDRRDKKKK